MMAAVVLVGLGVLLAALPQEPKTRRLPIKYGDRINQWIGKHFTLPGDRSIAFQMGKATGDYTLVAVGVDYAEFKHKQDYLLIVPLSGLRVQVDE
jgi:hypothetical protein